MGGDSGGSMDGSCMDFGCNEGNGVSYDDGVSRRLMSSSPSLSNSTSPCRFLVRFADGEMGCGDSTEAWALAVDAMTGDEQAGMVAGGASLAMAAMFVDIRRCGLCRKATKDGHILEAGDMVNLDACCVSGGDTIVVQRHKVKY